MERLFIGNNRRAVIFSLSNYYTDVSVFDTITNDKSCNKFLHLLDQKNRRNRLFLHDKTSRHSCLL